MAFFKTKRSARYWLLRQRHFLFDEAAALSALKRKYPPLMAMMKQRSIEWARFMKHANRQGWSPGKRRREWRDYIFNKYNSKGWVTYKNVRGKPYKRPHLNPWKWYDYVRDQLPPWDQWDTPRSHRKKPSSPHIDLTKIQKQRAISIINKVLRKTRDPHQIALLREQKRKLTVS